MDQGQGRRATTLLVTAAARESCRAVGTTAWAVLADLALDAEVDAKGRLVAETNVRRIAAHLAISKDCAARALLRLDGAGLVVRLRPRRGTCGRFAPSGYELRLGPDAGVALLRSSPAAGSPSPVPDDRAALPAHARRSDEGEQPDVARPRPRRTRRKDGVEQQPLFDLAGESSGLR